MGFVKRIITISMLIIVSMLIVPLIAVNTIKSDAAMLVVLILFFAVYPIISAFVGIMSGKEIKRLWYVPIMIAVLFWMFSSLTYQSAFPIVYSVAYFIISSISMMITHKINRNR